MPLPPGTPSKKENKTIASLLRALSFTGEVIGNKLDQYLGSVRAEQVKNNKIFKATFTSDKPVWVSVFFTPSQKTDIANKLSSIEGDPNTSTGEAEAKLANFILKSYMGSNIASPDKQFKRLFFNLIYTIASIDGNDLKNTYLSYFKAFIKGPVLDLLSKECIKGQDKYDCIFKELEAYKIPVLSRKPVASRGGRKTKKNRKHSKKYSRRK